VEDLVGHLAVKLPNFKIHGISWMPTGVTEFGANFQQTHPVAPSVDVGDVYAQIRVRGTTDDDGIDRVCLEEIQKVTGYWRRDVRDFVRNVKGLVHGTFSHDADPLLYFHSGI